jgi:hypothetical protein
MLILDATTKSIVVAMSGAAATTNPSYVTSYSDDTGTAFTEGSSDGALNGTLSVTIVASPASSTRRLIKTIYISNTDTAQVTLTVSYNDNSTLRQIAKVTLQVGDTWSTDGTTDSAGSLKTSVGFASSTGTGAVVLQTNPSITNPTITNYIETLQAVGTVGSTSTLALTNGTVLTATLTASTPCTFTMPTATAGKSFILKLIQASSGMTTATFTSVKWPSNTAPTLTTTASRWDILTFFADGTNWYGTYAQAFQ